MEKTERYQNAKHFIKKKHTFTCQFSKYGKVYGKDKKSVCLYNIRTKKRQIIDHIWCESETLVRAKLRTNQVIRITTIIKDRKRPNTNLFNKTPMLDIRLTKINILKNPKKRKKK